MMIHNVDMDEISVADSLEVTLEIAEIGGQDTRCDLNTHGFILRNTSDDERNRPVDEQAVSCSHRQVCCFRVRSGYGAVQPRERCFCRSFG